MKKALTLTCVFGGAVLSGCVTTPETPYDPIIPLDKSIAQNSSLTILADPLPKRATANDAAVDNTYQTDVAVNNAMNSAMASGATPAAAAAGGIIGLLAIAGIEAGINDARNDSLERLMAENRFDPEAYFVNEVVKRLASNGMRIEIDISERNKRSLFPPRETTNVATELSLDLFVEQYGVSLVPGTGWMPSGSAKVRMYRAADGQTVLKDSVAVGRLPYSIAQQPAPGLAGLLGGDTLIMPYNPDYQFKSIKNMTEERPVEGMEALKFSLDQLAEGVSLMIVGAATEFAAPAPEASPEHIAEVEPSEVGAQAADMTGEQLQ